MNFLSRVYHAVHRRYWTEHRRLQLAQRRFRNELRRRIPHGIRTVDFGPPAPESMIRITAGETERDIRMWLNPEFYFRTGLEQMLESFRALNGVAFNLRTMGAVLEFGCGTARLLRHLRCIDGIRLVGCDVSAELIEWSRQHVAGVEFYRNSLEPPLEFAEPGSFDLVMASAVFTSIPLDQQRAWLKEIRRVLRPGGVFLCTVIGLNYQQKLLTPRDRETLHKEGHLCFDSQDPRASFFARQTGFCEIYQTRAEVIEVFGSVFHMLDYIDRGAGGQDLLVLGKPR